MRTSTRAAVLALAALLPAAAPAQDSGRTDGPEGSEVGKGGYTRASGSGSFSLSVQWGAAVTDNAPHAPLFVGGAAEYWMEDWFQVELSGAYLFDTERGPDRRGGGAAVLMAVPACVGPVPVFLVL